jgi:hypothetical protein
MNIINPFTLLVVPLIGSLIILFYSNVKNNLENPRPRKELGHEKQDSSFNTLIAAPSPAFVASTLGSETGQGGKSSSLSVLGGERALSKIEEETLQSRDNSVLKKIAIITSVINFIFSIIL